MNTFSSFLDMGKYTIFILPAYGLSALMLVAVAVLSVRSLKTARATLQRLEEETL